MIVPGRMSSMTARMMSTGVALSGPGAGIPWRALLPVLGLSSVPATSWWSGVHGCASGCGAVACGAASLRPAPEACPVPLP
eukprot:6431998-Prorocentrum_lima.AAC.1